MKLQNQIKSKIDAKIVLVDMETVIPMYLCPMQSSQVENENATGWCNKCKNEALQSQCKEKS